MKKKQYLVGDYPGLKLFTWIFFIYLYAPMVVLVVYSFNESRRAQIWRGFSTDWYVKALTNDDIQSAAINSLIVSYLRSFDLAGKTARFDVRLPYQQARWQGLLDGQPASVERSGMADPRLRLSVNFLGAPALKGNDYVAYRRSHPVNTIAGAALAVTLPLGQYYEDKLLNLGGNRYVIRPQVGQVLRLSSNPPVFNDLCIIKRARSSMRHRDPIIVQSFLRLQVRPEMPFPDQSA